MQSSAIKDGYTEWLSKFDWQWFCTLTFRVYPPQTKATRLLKRWLAEMKFDNGSAHFGYFFLLESGASKESLHWHGLILGLDDRTERVTWILRWLELAGAAEIGHFDKGENAIWYSVKALSAKSEDVIVFDLHPADFAAATPSEEKESAVLDDDRKEEVLRACRKTG
jgi:hypothetical protein